jgi:hypothetical protein
MGFYYWIEFYLLRFARVKICVMPYGSDAYVYSRVQDRNWLFGLLEDYPKAATQQEYIAKRLNFYIRKADAFLPGAMIFDGMGRSDWITPSTLCIDTSNHKRVARTIGEKFIVTHAPNHRVVKGTKFVVESIQSLKSKGINVDLVLIEQKSNKEVIRILAEVSDLHIDQLFFDGYGLNALESMSIGVPTIGNFSGTSRNFFDLWSHTTECPLIIADEKSLEEVLLGFIENPESLESISKLSTEYVEKHHSYHSFSMNFSKIVAHFDERYGEYLKHTSTRITRRD